MASDSSRMSSSTEGAIVPAKVLVGGVGRVR
jgi:hypothetical protein